MKPHSKKQKIKAAILIWLSNFRDGDIIKSEELVKAVKRHLQVKYLYEGTVLRYARQLREEGKINYTCLEKSRRKFKIIPIGEPHSL